MRSWAFFIFEAATISIALVILRVLCTLLILLRISFDPAMTSILYLPEVDSRVRGNDGTGRVRLKLVRAVLLEILDGRDELFFVICGQVLRAFDPVHQRAILALHISTQR